MKRLHSLIAPVALALILAGCATAAEEPAQESESGHGSVAGAEQVAEAQPLLISIDEAGSVGLHDLLTDETTQLGEIAAPDAVASDGRYAFVTTADGLTIVDGGRWSWDHGDHFHYYRADPALLGAVPGVGPAAVTGAPLATAGGTGVFFSGSGDAVLLDNEALGDGEIVESFRIATGAESGVVAPVDTGAIVATTDEAAVYDAAGERIGEIECEAPSGAITTRVGTVVGCADGAILATGRIDALDIEQIPYPDGAAERAKEFDGRKNRPTVAALSGESGFWLLDTRARAWTHASVDASLVDVVAADDADGHVVALDADGRVRVYDSEGTELSASEPLVAESLNSGGIVDLVVDTQRAYLSDPAGGVVHEIDYADGARVARELTTPTTPFLATELGR
ncbi:ABC transporter [Microbacterium halotolerans]|uniref:ABC transporter n=1 Tax=Microbacterium halotolerans TaxID=246613 RepID=UPI000E6A9853|nr:ABC transporter [Microbacterium halotolerans]